jgi:hypothetical protein
MITWREGRREGWEESQWRCYRGGIQPVWRVWFSWMWVVEREEGGEGRGGRRREEEVEEEEEEEDEEEEEEGR